MSHTAENELTLNARVISMAELAGRLSSVRRLVVSRRAVVTPAARDELRAKGIMLVRGEACKPTAAKGLRVAMVVSGTDFDPAALVAALTGEGYSVDRTASDCLIAAVDQLAAEIKNAETLGVLLTSHVAAAVCLANRLPGVRAVAGANPAAVAADAAAVGANLLAVDPRAVTFFQLKRMAAEFCRGGVRPCPAVFCQRLA